MKACPFCKGRATKLLSISTGLLTCQQCGRSYEVEGVKEAVKKASEELERRFLYGEGTASPVGLLGRSPISSCLAPHEQQVLESDAHPLLDAVARPASSKARPRLRVAREDERTGGHAPRTRPS